jgi:lipopolysaccharide/colanic/teichoic acid biosynthesis glycosyltransferase
MMKKVFDLVLASVGLLALSPLLIAVAVAIKLSSPGPIFYRGERAGLDGRLFHIFKFRTMMVDAERRGPTSTPEDDPRVTPVGRFLRRHKLDELPQLVNVVAGDISLVGPRPQFKWAVDLYNDDERQLLTVRPGITDYASVRFRNESEILRGSADPDRDYLQKIHPEKVRLGLEYVRRRSLWIDFRLILATLWSMAGGNPESIIKIPSGRAPAMESVRRHEVA